MKKIPTLFERIYKDHKVIGIENKLTNPNLQVVLDGKAIPTVKKDGSCCAIIDGKFYKRCDAKHGKKPPKGAISCSEPDPITGHHPHWVLVDENNPADKWFIKAKQDKELPDGTYEAIGPHFQGNPYKLEKDILDRHGTEVMDLEDFSFEGIKKCLEENYIEGIVFWYNDEPLCKIKRKDFGLKWGEGKNENN